MDIRVRVRKNDVLILKREFIPTQYKTITSKDDNEEYKVKIKGTGAEKLSEIDKFPRPINGANLPDNIVEKYSIDEQEYMISHIHKANKEDGISAINLISEKAVELMDKMQFIDPSSPECSEFMGLLDKLRTKGKSLKWKKATPKKQNV